MSRDRSGDRPKTAAELMAELREDPEFVAQEQQHERQKQENEQLYARAAAPVLDELEAAGFRVRRVGELRRLGAEYPEAIPILIHWLPLVSYLPLKGDLVRTLSVPWARPMAGRALIEEFRRADDPEGTGIRWEIANALAVVADDDILDDVIQLVQDPRHGKAREMLTLALANMTNPRATSVLRDLLRDEQVVGHAVMALGKLGVPEVLSELEKLTDHPKEWVRHEAAKAVTRIRSRMV